MSDEPHPPLRLLVSSDAFQLVLAIDEAWQTVSASTDYEQQEEHV